MRTKLDRFPPVGQGCERVYVKVGIYHKRDFHYCKAHSWLELNKCVVCGELFHTNRKHVKTCGDKCRKRLSRMKNKPKRVIRIKTKAGIVEQEVMWS